MGFIYDAYHAARRKSRTYKVVAGSVVTVLVGSVVIAAPFGGGLTANVWVSASGAYSGCVRSDSPIAYDAAKDCSPSQAFATASSGNSVRLLAGNYGALTITSGTKSTSNPVVFTGTGATTVFTGITLGAIPGGNPTGLTLDGFVNNGGLTIKNTGGITLKNFTTVGYSYFAGTQNLTVQDCTFDGNNTTPDVLNVYEQTSQIAHTANFTMDHCVVKNGGDPSDTTTHPDGVQFCNCNSAGDSVHATGTVIKRSTFQNNECTNWRSNEQSDFTFESNLIFPAVHDRAISSCGGYAFSMERAAAWTMKNNTFLGTIQQTPAPTPAATQDWYGNYVQAFQSGCPSNGTRSKNWFVGSSCGGTNLTGAGSGMNTTTGVPGGGSALINAADATTFATLDLNGVTRPVGAAPDIGAFEQ